MERNLSRELRPQKLDDFIGCESVTKPILEGIRQGRIDSTYQFYGPPGTGKTSMARAVFKMICGVQTDYDLTEPDTGNLSADEIRDLIQRARIMPWIGNYKGIILDEAHKISAPTQIILLKALEEPAPSTIWFICSSSAGDLNEALRRRGVNFVLPGITSLADMARLICLATDHVGGEIGQKYTNQWAELAKFLMQYEVTSPGLVLRAVEKWITGVPANEAAQVSETTVVDTFGIAKAAAAGKWPAVQKLLVTAPKTAGRDIRNAVAGYFRAILVKESTGPRAERCVWAIEQMAELANQNQFEDGLIMSATCAALYKICVGQKEYMSKKGA